MKPQGFKGPWRYALYLSFAAIAWYLNYYVPRTHFFLLAGLYAALCVLYILFVRNAQSNSLLREGIILGIAVRVLLAFSVPNLSDDFYRFLWDGRLMHSGISPYAFKPENLVSDIPSLTGISDSLYRHLNSASYFSIYPPVSQAIFYVATSLPRDYQAIVCMKLILVLFEGGTIYFLTRLLRLAGRSPRHILWYALNPLVLLEFCGNLHFECVMIFFLCAALYYVLQKKELLSAVLFALATGSKLWPLMLLPVIFRFLPRGRNFIYVLVSVLLSALLILPMLLSRTNVMQSFDLYFRQFEFNAGIYYVLKWLIHPSQHYTAFQHMQKILPIVCGFLILALSFLIPKKFLISGMLLVFTLYFLCATTLHPWYITPLIPLALPGKFRFAVAWSFVIFLSYVFYDPVHTGMYYTLIALEYMVVLIFLVLDLRKKRGADFPLALPQQSTIQ